MARSGVVQARLAGLTAAFAHYVNRHDELTPVTSRQATARRATVAALRTAGGVEAALADREFVTSLYRTLRAWGLGKACVADEADGCVLRRPAGGPPRDHRVGVVPHRRRRPAQQDRDRVWHVVDGLGVVDNKAKVVAGSKTLHHLLLDLVVPMDREWTGTFFGFAPAPRGAPLPPRLESHRSYRTQDRAG